MEVLDYAASMFESILFVLFLNQFCGCRCTGRRRLFGSLLAVFLLCFHIMLTDLYAGVNGTFSLMADALILTAYWYGWLERGFLKYAAGFVLYYLGLYGSSLLPVIGMELLAGSGMGAWTGTDVGARILLLLLCKSLLLLYVCVVLHMKDRFFLPTGRTSYLIYLVLPLLVFFSCFCIMGMLLDRAVSKQLEMALLLVMGVTLLLLALMLYLAARTFQKEKALREAERRESAYMAERKQAEQLYESLREMGRVRHEIVNRLLAVSYLLEKGKYEEGKEHLQNCIEEWGRSGNFEGEGELWSAVVAQKAARYPEYRNCIHLRVEPGDYSRIDTVDFCILLGNLMENALEAQEYAREHFIELYMQEKYRCLYLRVENTCGPVEEESKSASNPAKAFLKRTVDFKVWNTQEKPVTTKREKLRHGFGLQNVQEIVDRYHGTMEIDRGEEMFIVKILLEEKDTKLDKSVQNLPH